MNELNIFDEPFEKYISNIADEKKIPYSAIFEISPICNMNCEMCYITKKKKEVYENGGLLDIDFWVNLAKAAMKEGLLFLLITGGEPFLYENFKELYLKLHSLGIYISINTNATLIDEEVISWLKENPPKRLNISLYGTSDEDYNKVCKNPKGFTQVNRAINLLRQNHIAFRINSVLSQENSESYYDILNFAEKCGAPLNFNYYMFPSIRKENDMIGVNDGRVSPQKAGEMAFRHFCNYNSGDKLFGALEKACYDLDNKTEITTYKKDRMFCRAGSSSFWVNWKGEMQTCGIMIEPKIDLKNTSFIDAWNYIKEETSKIRLSYECSNCEKREFCQICPAAAYSETGAFNKKPQYLCDLTDKYIELIITEYKKRKLENND